MPLISSGHCRHCARNRRPTRHAGLAPLHFTEDSGSPPYAAEIRGLTHLKMENWVDASKIHLANYEPRNLGADDAAALEGFERRMKELIEYSKPRGQRLMTPVLIGNRKAVEPVAPRMCFGDKPRGGRSPAYPGSIDDERETHGWRIAWANSNVVPRLNVFLPVSSYMALRSPR